MTRQIETRLPARRGDDPGEGHPRVEGLHQLEAPAAVTRPVQRGWTPGERPGPPGRPGLEGHVPHRPTSHFPSGDRPGTPVARGIEPALAGREGSPRGIEANALPRSATELVIAHQIIEPPATGALSRPKLVMSTTPSDVGGRNTPNGSGATQGPLSGLKQAIGPWAATGSDPARPISVAVARPAAAQTYPPRQDIEATLSGRLVGWKPKAKMDDESTAPTTSSFAAPPLPRQPGRRPPCAGRPPPSSRST